MVLMLQDGEDAGFFVLSQNCARDKLSYSLWPWPAGDLQTIEAGDCATIPEAAAKAVTDSVPIPRDGSLFGWTCEDDITALIVIYAQYTPEYPEPGWAVMPLADTSQERWPSFTGQPLFGHWSWDLYHKERMISLDDVFAGAPDTAYWVNTTTSLGSHCCAVARDISSLGGYALRRGRYVDYQSLLDGKLVPSLEVLLANPSKIDLAPRFQRTSHSDRQADTTSEPNGTGII